MKKKTRRRLVILGIAVIGLSLVAGLLAIFVAGGSGQRQPKMEQVRVGMTMAEVEKVLGKPVWTWKDPDRPNSEIRHYGGDGDHTISVTFDNEIVVEIREYVPRHGIKVAWSPRTARTAT